MYLLHVWRVAHPVMLVEKGRNKLPDGDGVVSLVPKPVVTSHRENVQNLP